MFSLLSPVSFCRFLSNFPLGRKTAWVAVSLTLLGVAHAASFSYDFAGATDYSANFSVPSGGTAVSYDSAKRYLIFNTAEATNLVSTIKPTASGQTSLQNEALSLDVVPISYPYPNTAHNQYQWVYGSVGIYARVQSSNLGVLAVATLLGESSVRLRLFHGASITSPNTVGTAFWDATFDLAAGTISHTVGSGGDVEVNKLVTQYSAADTDDDGVPDGSPYTQLIPFTMQLLQNGSSNPTFELTLTNSRGLIAKTANVALTSTSNYNGAGAVGVRFYSAGSPNPAKFAVDNFWAQGAATVTVDRSVTPEVSKTVFGATYTQKHLDSYGDATANNLGRIIMRDSTELQNQHMMGFGVLSPNETANIFNWTTLDARFAMMDDLATGWTFGGTSYAANDETDRVVTLALCPDWLKGGSQGQTIWSTAGDGDPSNNNWLERAPLPVGSTPGSKYTDFTKLVKELAGEYASATYYQVWNEMKGLWNGSNDWDWPRYMELYNETYTGLRSVPNRGYIKIGGPYLPIQGNAAATATTPLTTRDSNGLDYWLQYMTGADFLCADFSLTRDQSYVTESSIMARTWLYEAIVQQVNGLPNQPSTPLPFWWSEYYGWAANKDLNFQRSVMASILLHQVAGGTAVSLLWGPQDNPSEGLRQGLFTSTASSGGGQPLPFYTAYQKIHDNFRKGALVFPAVSDTAGVQSLANGTSTMVVNKRPVPVSVTVEGSTITLGAYDVQLVAAAEQIIDDLDSAWVTLTGDWSSSTSVSPYYNQNYIHDGNWGQGTKSVRFTPHITASGSYDVYIRWPVAANRATNTPIDVVHAGGTFSTTVNQTATYSGDWKKITTSPVTFSAGTSGSVLIKTTSANGFVIVDAVRFVRQ